MNVRTQTFNPGELPLVLLALAEIEPRKAYEFLSELKRLFGPGYRPSPGGVYPALTALREEGLVDAEMEGRANRYYLTSVGREALDKRRDQLAALEERTGARVQDDASLRPALDRFTQRVMKLSGRVEPEDVVAVLDRAAKEIEKMRGGVRVGK